MDTPALSARTTISLFAWYVLTRSDARSSRSSATKPSVYVYRNSTGAGGASTPAPRGAVRTTAIPLLLPRQWSSLRIQPIPVESAMSALLLAPLRLTANHSSASSFLSGFTETVIVLLVSPGANVTLPEAAT